MADYIWGRYPVLEALRSRRRVRQLFVAQGPRDPAMTQVLDQARRVGVAVETVSRRRLDDLSKNSNHQGVMAIVTPRTYAELDDILQRAEELREQPLLVVLDMVQDVQNLGSLIRTAEVVGAHGVVIPEHRAAGLTPAVDKTSAGAVEFMPVTRVTNITRTLDDLKRRGIWCVGLDGNAKTTFDQANLTGPIALVVGNEGKGISRLVRDHCDLLIKLPMRGHVASLNAGVAGSIALYEIWRQRKWVMPTGPGGEEQADEADTATTGAAVATSATLAGSAVALADQTDEDEAEFADDEDETEFSDDDETDDEGDDDFDDEGEDEGEFDADDETSDEGDADDEPTDKA
ncbi:MAG TPA: 23S rRNA (guanosine(2251)-2'-O)-methyltransferase RlmB [Ktedonobacterales bacterium]|nr:23S rRNA (guanosine(2251)-2'-O)-methyltransferase RlmB [Ktedonobacterales bacterium]